jgi:hypothetical protein
MKHPAAGSGVSHTRRTCLRVVERKFIFLAGHEPCLPIKSLRLIWAFFHWKCGKLLTPFMRQNMNYIAAWKPFNITPEIKAKLLKISPARIDYYLRADKAALKIKGKSLSKPVNALKSRIPIRAFYTGGERKTPGFIQIDTVHHCGQSTKGEYNLTLTAADVFSGWINRYSLLNKAHKWTFAALRDITNTLPSPLWSFTATTALNLSITPLKNGVTILSVPSRLHAPETARKTTTLLLSRKTGRWFGSMPAITG